MVLLCIVLGAAAAMVTAGTAATVCVVRRKKKKTKLVPSAQYGISVEEVPAEEIDGDALCEIGDLEVADRVKALMPEAVRAELSAGLIVTKCSRTAYRVILPMSTKLASSTAGGVGLGAPMAAAQVGTLVTSSFSAVMSAASMVVGQYYMTLVNRQIKGISEKLSRLGSFQNNEYKSKVFALHAQVMRSAAFRAEVMAHAELREAEIAKLDQLEQTCIELLGQAALTIGELTERPAQDYESYVRTTADLHNWVMSQRVLLATLYEIADLRFALYLGAASRKQCEALLPVYEKQAEETQAMLVGWHAHTAEKLGLDLGEAKRKRKGLDRAVHWLPGLFKKELRYREIPAATVALIEEQTGENAPTRAEQDDLFHTDVEIIAKDGKLYYLPNSPHHPSPRPAPSDASPAPASPTSPQDAQDPEPQIDHGPQDGQEPQMGQVSQDSQEPQTGQGSQDNQDSQDPPRKSAIL